MNIVIVGCGRVGSELAYRLFKRGHQVAIIDQTEQAFNNLNPDFLGRTIEGEALNLDVLLRAGIVQADGVVAVTVSDSLNAVVAHVARTAFNVPYVFVRNYDPRWRSTHEAYNLQLVSSSSWGAQRLEELLYHAEITPVYSAGNGEVEVYEFLVPARWDGHRLEELIPDSTCAPVALTRAGRALIPACDIRLQQGDIINISATLEGIEGVRVRLNAQEEVQS